MNRIIPFATGLAFILCGFAVSAWAAVGDVNAIVGGPFLSYHFLNRQDINSHVRRINFPEFDDGQLAFGGGARAFHGYLVGELEVEGYSQKNSEDGVDLTLGEFGGLANVGFNLLPKSKLKVYALGGLGGNRNRIKTSSSVASDESVRAGAEETAAVDDTFNRYGLLGNIAVGADYLIGPFGGDPGFGVTLFGRVGYMGELYRTDWSDDRMADDLTHDFSGAYVRIGVGLAYLHTSKPRPKIEPPAQMKPNQPTGKPGLNAGGVGNPNSVVDKDRDKKPPTAVQKKKEPERSKPKPKENADNKRDDQGKARSAAGNDKPRSDQPAKAAAAGIAKDDDKDRKKKKNATVDKKKKDKPKLKKKEKSKDKDPSKDKDKNKDKDKDKDDSGQKGDDQDDEGGKKK